MKLFHCISDTLNEWKNKNNSEYSTIDVIGVGTEVFRKAKNGEEYLKTLSRAVMHSIPKPKEIPEKKSAVFGSDAAVGGKKNQDLVSNKPTISFQSKPEASKEVKVAAEMDLKTNKCITTAAADKEKSVQKNTSSRARAASPPQPPRPHPKKAAIAAQPPAKIDYNKKEAELDETDEILVEENVTFSEVFEEDYDSEEKEDNSPKTDRSKNSPVSNRSSIDPGRIKDLSLIHLGSIHHLCQNG